MNKEFKLQNVPSVSRPLIFFLLVVLATAWMTGGIGLRSFGSEAYGGKKFIYIIAGILGYFAISVIAIPDAKVNRYAGLFFLSGASAVLPNLIYMAGPAMWLLFVFFPTDMALSQAFEDFSPYYVQTKFSRVTGVTFASLAVFMYLLARFGLAGVLNTRKPLRLVVFLLTFVLSLLGGYRSAFLIFALVCAFQFYFEGLHKTRLFVVVLAAVVVGAVAIIPLASKLPLSVQRSLSMLPLDIDPIARADAQASLEWRLEIWKALLPQIKTYFWLGKGYAINPSDIYLSAEAAKRGFKLNDPAIVTGDYHSGPLSVIIPLGIFGAIGFLWFIFASIRALYLNYKFSEASRRTLNTFLLSYFVARFVFFVVGMGAVSSDMPLFAGLIAFSVALNGGVRKQSAAQVSLQEEDSSQPLEGSLAPVPT